jgi:hypothetical protein
VDRHVDHHRCRLAPWLFNLYVDPNEECPVDHRQNAWLASMTAENEGPRREAVLERAR